jgi:hypothetical protein
MREAETATQEQTRCQMRLAVTLDPRKRKLAAGARADGLEDAGDLLIRGESAA